MVNRVERDDAILRTLYNLRYREATEHIDTMNTFNNTIQEMNNLLETEYPTLAIGEWVDTPDGSLDLNGLNQNIRDNTNYFINRLPRLYQMKDELARLEARLRARGMFDVIKDELAIPVVVAPSGRYIGYLGA